MMRIIKRRILIEGTWNRWRMRWMRRLLIKRSWNRWRMRKVRRVLIEGNWSRGREYRRLMIK